MTNKIEIKEKACAEDCHLLSHVGLTHPKKDNSILCAKWNSFLKYMIYEYMRQELVQQSPDLSIQEVSTLHI